MAKKSDRQAKTAATQRRTLGADVTPAPALSDSLARDLHRQVLGWFRRRLSNANDAEDLVQETMLRMVRSLHSLRSKDRLQPWILRIARGVLADYWKARFRVTESELDAEAHSSIDSSTVNATKELVGCLEIFTQRLPEPYREAVELSEMRGLPHREIAGKLGLSISGVKSRVQRGREQLKLLVLECCAIDLYGGEVRSVERRANRTGDEPCFGDKPFGCIGTATATSDEVRDDELISS